MCGIFFNFAGYQVAGDDAARFSIDYHQVEHLAADIHFHLSFFDLPAQCAVCAQQQLLSGLTAGIECAAYLCASKRAIVKQTAVIACKGYALRNALVYDIICHFGKTMNVGFAGAVIAALYGIVIKTIDRIAVVWVVFGGVDSALRGNRVCTARTVLNTKVQNVKSHFAETCCCSGSSQTGTYDDDVQFEFVGGIHKVLMRLVICPFLGYGTLWYFCV